MICGICGKEVNNPEHPSHVNSRYHQETLKFKKMANDIKDLSTVKYKDDPGTLNILISHVERCGVSWFCRLISLIYEQMYGKLKKWNIRTSRLMAAHPDYPMQKGWNTVRYTPIKNIIRKPFDKIILLQRKIDSLKESIFIYRFTDKDYNIEKDKPEYEEWFDKLDKYYKQTYAPVNDPRVMRVYLEDLNNYTASTLNNILDFLGFPKKGRPMIIPVNPPERTWEAFSAVLNKGQEITERLRNIYYKYNDAELEFEAQRGKTMITSSDIIGHDNELLPIEKRIQKNWQINMNPEVDIQDALEVLKDKKINYNVDVSKNRLNITVIGEIGIGLGCHFSENVSREFKKLGADVTFLTFPRIATEMQFNIKYYHINNDPRRYLSLSKILNFYNLRPDMVFIDGSRFLIVNDTKHFVFYNHRGWHLPFSVMDMTVAFLKNESYKEMRERCNIRGKMMFMPPSVNLDVYKPEEKEITEPVGIGYRRTFGAWRKIVSMYEGYESIVNLLEAETMIFKKAGYKYFNTPINDLQYRELLKKIKIFWFPIPYGQHVTRRMLEAMSSKTLCVFRLDNRKHEEYLAKLGFINNIHYIGLKDMKTITQISQILRDVNIDEIIENAYKVVKQQHTHEVRAKQIIQIYNDMTQKIDDKFDVIVPMYNIQENILSYVENWFEELPINRLIIGVGKDDFEIPYKYKNYIVKIDQKKNKTLGKCLTDMMKEVKTQWFIYLHSDVKIMEHAFEIMKKNMTDKVGGIEGGPIVYARNRYTYHARQYAKRAYSGFQMFRTECLKDLMNKIEDDYVYRNEDMITQNAVLSSGYEYKKTWAMYIHYNEGLYKKTEKDAKEIFLGLIKYTIPDDITKSLMRTTIRSYFSEFKKIDKNDIEEIVEFTKKHNINWLTIIDKLLRELLR